MIINVDIIIDIRIINAIGIIIIKIITTITITIVMINVVTISVCRSICICRSSSEGQNGLVLLFTEIEKEDFLYRILHCIQ
jgi:hypothetical protein